MNACNAKNKDATEEQPLNEWMARGRQGDTQAVLLYCRCIEPIIDSFCKDPFLLHRLGRDEIRSAASLAALEFMSDYTGTTPDKEIPYLLRRVLRCSLLQAVRRDDTRLRHEGPNGSSTDTTDGNAPAEPADDPDKTPEALFLRAARRQQVQAALQTLPDRERAVINALYFRCLDTLETAQEIGVTRNYVQKLQRRALTRLRKCLRRQAITEKEDVPWNRI